MLYRANNSINPDGTYQGQLVYEAAKTLNFTVATEDTGLSHTDTQIYAHSLTKLDAGTSVQGGIYRANNTLNPDGTYNGDLTYQGSKADSIYASWATQDGTAGFYTFRNQSTLPTVISGLTTATKNSVVLGINDDKTYDASIHILPGDTTISGGGTFTFYLSEQHSSVKQVSPGSGGKWWKQMWTRYERYDRNKATAIGYTDGTTKENVSVTLQNLHGYGPFWLAVWWIRDGAATEIATSNA
jgi:hypothetical protein